MASSNRDSKSPKPSAPAARDLEPNELVAGNMGYVQPPAAAAASQPASSQPASAAAAAGAGAGMLANAAEDELLQDVIESESLRSESGIPVFLGCCGKSLNASTVNSLKARPGDNGKCPLCAEDILFTTPNIALNTALQIIDTKKSKIDDLVLEVKKLRALADEFKAPDLKDVKDAKSNPALKATIKGAAFSCAELQDPVSQKTLSRKAVVMSCCGHSFNPESLKDAKSCPSCKKDKYTVGPSNKAIDDALTLLERQDKDLDNLHQEVSHLQTRLAKVPLDDPMRVINNAAHVKILNLLRLEQQIAAQQKQKIRTTLRKAIRTHALEQGKVLSEAQLDKYKFMRKQQEIMLGISKKRLSDALAIMTIDDEKAAVNFERLSSEVKKEIADNQASSKQQREISWMMLVKKYGIHQAKLTQEEQACKGSAAALTHLHQEKVQLFAAIPKPLTPSANLRAQKNADLALLLAVEQNDIAEAKACLEEADANGIKADPNIKSLPSTGDAKTEKYELPLATAIMKQNAALVALLLKHGADTNAKCRLDGKFEQLGGYLSVRKYHGVRLLSLAAPIAVMMYNGEDSIAILDLILSAKPNLDGLNNNDLSSPLLCSLVYGGVAEVVVRKLLHAGLQPKEGLIDAYEKVKVAFKAFMPDQIKKLIEDATPPPAPSHKPG